MHKTFFYVKGERKLYCVHVVHWLPHYIHLSIMERQVKSFLVWKWMRWITVFSWVKHDTKSQVKSDPLDSEVRQVCEQAVREYEIRVKDTEEDNIKDTANELGVDVELLKNPDRRS